MNNLFIYLPDRLIIKSMLYHAKKSQNINSRESMESLISFSVVCHFNRKFNYIYCNYAFLKTIEIDCISDIVDFRPEARNH